MSVYDFGCPEAVAPDEPNDATMLKFQELARLEALGRRVEALLAMEFPPAAFTEAIHLGRGPATVAWSWWREQLLGGGIDPNGSREMAEKIAYRLFTDGSGSEAVTLRLQGFGGGDLGGWSKRAAVARIREVLDGR